MNKVGGNESASCFNRIGDKQAESAFILSVVRFDKMILTVASLQRSQGKDGGGCSDSCEFLKVDLRQAKESYRSVCQTRVSEFYQ